MSRGNWLTVIGSCLGFIIGLLWGLQEGFATHPQHQHQQNAGHTPEYYQEVQISISRRDLFAQQTMAFATIALFVLTLVALRITLKTASDALAETRKSNENYVRNERGMLAFAENQLAVNFPNRTLDYTYRNIGNGPLTVERVLMILDEVPTTPGDTTRHRRGADTFITVAAGDLFTSWEHDGMKASMTGLGHPIEAETLKRFETGAYSWRAAVEISYRLPVGAVYLNRISWFLPPPSAIGPNAMRVELGNDVTFDRMVIDERGREVRSGTTA